MSIPRPASEARRPPLNVRRRRPALAWPLATLLLACVPAPTALAQASAASQPAVSEDDLIVTLRINGIVRGEFTVRRRPDGDYWVASTDLERLRLEPVAAAARREGGEEFWSLRGLGAQDLRLEEAELTLDVDFPAARLEGTRIDLASRPPPPADTRRFNSLILSYRLAVREGSSTQAARTSLTTDLNARVGPVLLRQEMLVDTGAERRTTRGVTQAIWDHRPSATRVIAGDALSSAGPFGTAITGAGLQISKLYDLQPDLVRHPAARLQTSTALPAQVEVAVDGNTVYRGQVDPGPIFIDNLMDYGGARNIRITVTDVTGRREVYEQPFLFTDSVLTGGLHEYRYFIGRRSELDSSSRWRYREAAWQGFHRYGLSDSLTIGAGGEGSREFTSGGAGFTLRSDRFGLLALEALASRDHQRQRLARGWSARYTWATPDFAFLAGERRYGEGFRSFSYSGDADQRVLRRETRLGASTRVFDATLAADLVRTEENHEKRDSAAARLTTRLARGISLSLELQSGRSRRGPEREREWQATLFLRADLDRNHWAGAIARSTRRTRGLDLEVGRNLDPGEGWGYRAGFNSETWDGQHNAWSHLNAQWNLRAASVEFNGTQQVRGGSSRHTELALSGALVAVDGDWGLTRRVGDSFVLARLGVPQPGIGVFLNNQLQGVTDDEGKLFIPQVSAFGRQDVSLDDNQLPMQYQLQERRRTIAPEYRSGNVVDFGGKRLQAVAGMTWLATPQGRQPVASRQWTMASGSRELSIETSRTGDFYLEDAPPGEYRGVLELEGRRYACRMTIPPSSEPVQELPEGLVCE